MTEIENKLLQKIKKDLLVDNPYDIMLYIQTFIGRKLHSLSNQQLIHLLFLIFKEFLNKNEISSCSTLYEWLLKLNRIEEKEDLYSLFQSTLQLTKEINQKNGIQFLLLIFNSLTSFINNKENLNSYEKTKLLYELNQQCGELFEQTKQWRDAKNSYLSIGDISSVVRIIHLWSEEGYQYEYPLFFVRTYLLFLINKLIPQATAFFRCTTDEYMDSYEFTLQHQQQQQQLNRSNPNKYYSIWQMCIIINELLGLMDTPSLITKINSTKIYQLILEKYENILKDYDMNLYEMAVQIGYNVFNVPHQEANRVDNNPMQIFNQLFEQNLTR